MRAGKQGTSGEAMERAELIELFSNNEVFATAPESAVEQLVDAGEVRSITPGEELIRQGATGESIWLLLEGELEVLVHNKVVNEIDQCGEILGEISAVSLVPATATVRSKSEGSAFCISHRDLHKVIDAHPHLAATMLRSMAKYIGRM